MSAFVKAASDALHLVPAVNAVIDGDELVYRDYTDISIAVATPKGLVVPVLRNVDALNFAGIEKVCLERGSSELHVAIQSGITATCCQLQSQQLHVHNRNQSFPTPHCTYVSVPHQGQAVLYDFPLHCHN